MRTVLIGSDFIYNSNEDLIPIEINTNTGWDDVNVRIESNEESLDLTDLVQFISNNGFTKIEYIGALPAFYNKLTASVDIECNITSVYGSITVPVVEDSETTLIIRSAYDTTAIVDSMYCANKVNFLNLIKDSTFASTFAYLDESNNLVNSITSILDNGIHPNFILKAVGPNYDKTQYPKLFKVSTQEELNTILTNVNQEYFLMPYYFNSDKLHENHIQVVRSLNLLFPPNLESIQIGHYHKICSDMLDDSPEYDVTTFEYLGNRAQYLTSFKADSIPTLEDTDLVEMADGSFKTALDLVIGDELKTIDVPNPNNVDVIDEEVNYLINIDDLTTGSTYSTNRVTGKKRINRKTYTTIINFQDNTNWSDVSESKYLVERDGLVRFIRIGALKKGDIVLLIDTASNELSFVHKVVDTIERHAYLLNGWTISVERTHLFLTKSDESSTTSFVAIEHNNYGDYCYCGGNFGTPYCNECNAPGCGKGYLCYGSLGQTSYGNYDGYCSSC